MADLLRPEPRPPHGQRLGRLLGAVNVARLATGTGAVLLLAVTAWWLLRAPAPPVERSLPSARTTQVRPPATSDPTAGRTGVPSAPGASGRAADGRTPSSGAGAAVATPATTLGPDLVVQAAGAVTRPGVYRVPSGARVEDVVTAAGGPSPDADLQAVALAARATDGARVYVPRQGETLPVAGASPPNSAAASATTPSPAAPLDLNQATAAELDTLPGVGPATAKAIVDYRTAHGPFSSVDDLLDVRGIGPAKLDGFRDLVTVG